MEDLPEASSMNAATYIKEDYNPILENEPQALHTTTAGFSDNGASY
jgi:hypothetical protein